MNTRFKWLFLILLFVAPAYAQNVRVDNVTFSSVQGFPFLPGATITICTAAGTGLPCSPTVSGTCLSISDTTCNQSATITSDTFGNYGFWIQPGSYTYTVTKAGFGGFGPRALTLSCQPASTCTTTGPQSFQSIGPVKFANATTTGTDCVAKINTQDVAIGTGPGEIDIDTTCGTTWTSVLSQSGPRIYKILGGGTFTIPTGTLAFTKSSLFDCGNRANTVLNFTGVGTGFVLNWDTPPGTTGSYIDWYSGVQNCQIFGPGGINGNGNAGTAFQVGGSNNGSIGVHIRNNLVGGWTNTVTWNQSTSWGTDLDNDSWINDTNCPVWNQPAESMKMSGGVCGSTSSYQVPGFQVTGNVINGQLFNNEFDGAQYSQSTGNIVAFGTHYENVTFNTTSPFHLQTGGFYSGQSEQYLQTQASGSVPPELADINGGRYSVFGSAFTTNATMSQEVLLENAAEYHEYGAVTQCTNFTSQVSAAVTWTGVAEFDNSGCAATGPIRTLWASGSGSPSYRLQRHNTSPTFCDMRMTDNLGTDTWELACGATTYIQAVPTVVKFPTLVQAGGGLTVLATQPLTFAEGTAPVSSAGNDVCYGDSTAHAEKCSYNAGSFFNQTQTIGTGNVTTAGTAINTLTCQAQTGITVTGAATTDNVIANIGAALPATWQTGIAMQAHVTATNTVTVYLCNPTATATITPAATQVNVRVVR